MEVDVDVHLDEEVKELIKNLEAKMWVWERIAAWLQRNSSILGAMGSIVAVLTLVGLIIGLFFSIPHSIEKLGIRVAALEKYHQNDQPIITRLSKLEAENNTLQKAFKKTGYATLATNLDVIEKSIQEISGGLTLATNERTELKGEIEKLGIELSGDIKVVEATLEGKIKTATVVLEGKINTATTKLSTEIESTKKELSSKIDVLDFQNKLTWAATKFEAKKVGLAEFKNGRWSVTDYGAERLAKHDLHKIVQTMVVVHTSKNPKPVLDETAFIDNLLQMAAHNRFYFENLATKLNLGVRQLVGTMIACAHGIANTSTNGTMVEKNP